MNRQHAATRQYQRLTGMALALLCVSTDTADDDVSPNTVSDIMTMDTEKAG